MPLDGLDAIIQTYGQPQTPVCVRRRFLREAAEQTIAERNMMLNADEVVDAYYLEVRCMLLEIAATLDRLDRASTEGSPTEGSPTDGGPTGGGPDANRSTQVDRLYRALEMLSDRQTSADRSERLLHLFSE